MYTRFRKPGFPVVCPQCNLLEGRPNGRRKSVCHGMMQQVRCSACKCQWSFPIVGPEPLFSDTRSHLKDDRLLDAIALFVIGVPMEAVEKILAVKAETLKAKVISLIDSWLWDMCDHILQKRYRIPKWDRSEFRREIVESRQFDGGEKSFRWWGRRLCELDPNERERSLRLATRIAGRSVRPFIGPPRPRPR
jgi:hypothetical protein